MTVASQSLTLAQRQGSHRRPPTRRASMAGRGTAYPSKGWWRPLKWQLMANHFRVSSLHYSRSRFCKCVWAKSETQS